MPVIDPNIAKDMQRYNDEYMQRYPDVAKDGTMDAYTHYTRHGKSEGRTYGPQGLVAGAMQPQQPQAPKMSREEFKGWLPGIAEVPAEALDQLYTDYEKWLTTIDPRMFAGK